MPKEVEEALAAWRAAIHERDTATDGNREQLDAAVDRARSRFHQLSADFMIDRIDALHKAEGRRCQATPSTPEFHQAARDEKEIATEIWDSARISDEEIPRR